MKDTDLCEAPGCTQLATEGWVKIASDGGDIALCLDHYEERCEEVIT